MDPFIGEIRAFSFGFTPKGWAQCNGALLPINSNQALFSLLGATYGGNGQTTFGLPDLRGRVALSSGTGAGLSQYVAGQTGGLEAVALTAAQTPQHTHGVNATTDTGSVAVPSAGGTDNIIASSATRPSGGVAAPLYSSSGSVPLATGSVAAAGGGSHSNLQPSTTTNYCIALTGYFPTRA